jgi:uncharacterized protein
MELSGDKVIPLPQPAVWDALNDPAVLERAVPGCESLTQVTDGEFQIGMIAAVGPVRARFKGRLFLEDVELGQSYTLRFEGNGGAAGFGKGAAKVKLIAEDGATRLTYAVDAQVGGKIAQLGARLMQGVAQKLADQFFANFTAQLDPLASSGA